MSTGIYVRIKKDGAWASFELDELTEPELISFFADKDKNQVVHWLFAVVQEFNKRHSGNVAPAQKENV